VLQIIPRPISVSVSSVISEPVDIITQRPQPVDDATNSSASATAAAAATGVQDEYEIPQPESNRVSWATEFNDESFYENDG